MRPYLKYYREHRKYQWKWSGSGKNCKRAAYALEYAKIKWLFDQFAAYVRLDVVADESCTFEDLEGDCYDPKVNSNISPHVLIKQRNQERARIERDGTWALVLKQLDTEGEEKWGVLHSCSGFIGNDWKYSGYDKDLYVEGVRVVARMFTVEVDAGWVKGTSWQQFGLMSSVEAWLSFQDALRQTEVLNLYRLAHILRVTKKRGAVSVNDDLKQMTWMPESYGASVSPAASDFFLGAVEYELQRRQNETTRADQEIV